MSDEQFVLDIRFPDQPPKRFDINGKVAMGNDERCKIHIPGYDLAPIHCIFLVKEGVLTMQNTGGDRPTILEGRPLEHGKNYILEVGDKLEIGNIDLIIRIQEEEDLPDSTLVRNLFAPGDSDSTASKQGTIADLLKAIDTEKEKSEDSISFNVEVSSEVKKAKTLPASTEKTSTNLHVNLENSKPIRTVKEKTATKSLIIEHGKRDEAGDKSVKQSSSFFDSVTKIISRAKKEEKNKKTKKKEPSVTSSKKLKLKGKGHVDSKASLKNTNKNVPKIKATSAKGKTLPKAKRPVIELDIVGTLPRLCCVIAGLSIVHVMINVLGVSVDATSIAFIKDLTAKLWTLASVESIFGEKASNLVYKTILKENTIQFTLLYFALELVSTLLIGSTIPQALFGITSTGSALTKRLKGVLRVIIGMITFPFVLFDLPALVKKRTLKEVLSGNSLYFSFRPLKYLGFFLVIAIIFAPLEIPFFTHDGPNAKRVESRKIIQTGDLAKVYTLPFLGLQVSAELEDYEIYPRLGRSKMTPIGLDFYKKNSLVRAGIRKEKEIDATNLLTQYESGNFFFSLTNPILSDSLETKTPLPGADKELENILSSAFNITTQTLPQVLLSQGPELKKLYEFKEAFLTEVGIKENSILEILATKNFNIYSFFHPDDSLYSLVIIHDLKIIVFQGDYSRSVEQLTELVDKLFPLAEFPQKLKLSDTKILAFELANLLHHYKFNGLIPTAQDLQKFVDFYKEKLSELSASEDAARKEKIIKGHLGEILGLLASIANTGNWHSLKEYNDLQAMETQQI